MFIECHWDDTMIPIHGVSDNSLVLRRSEVNSQFSQCGLHFLGIWIWIECSVRRNKQLLTNDFCKFVCFSLSEHFV